MSTLKVATTNFGLRAEPSLDDLLSHMDAFIGRAASAGAELVVLPEFASTGLLAAITDHAVTGATVPVDYRDVLAPQFDAIADGVKYLAAKHNLVVVGGSHNRIADDGSLRNTAIVAHPDGRVETQDKIHLTPPEHAMGARGGDELLVTRIGPFTAGVLICADIQFPELSRYLVSRGVDLVICPSLTWNRRGVHRVRIGCQARAIENQLYVVMSPLVGSSGLPEDAPLHAVGQALISTPVDKTIGINDGLLAISAAKGEDLVVAELDHDLLTASRAQPEAPGLALRRTDLFAKLRAEAEF
ncbi:nitrilase-related carbon-nitrogen hydrolase [uncultured Mycolicibacterium sp.]|uniref:nitrilase-related carbon-nitrogen hydrolase n=1 Tax=uncultured Mycolicibacterium sp. TaxID=2320817 RepID=UPI00260AA213|nr:nitrilase-related carbon-nitrogen hydrolase [uncultured Mycolicibacterium sp.]